MSDLGFDGDMVNHVNNEEDPAAAFMAREQEELAGLEDDDNLGLRSDPPVENSDFQPATTNEQEGVGAYEDNLNRNTVESQPEPSPATEMTIGQDDQNIFEDNLNYGMEDRADSPIENFLNMNSSNEHLNGPSEPFPPTASSRNANREEPQKIKIWREEQQEMLKVKDSEEEKKKLELKEGAKKELDDWYALYKEQIEKSKLNNRNAEKEWIADRDAESPGQEWERIARLCDFNPKSSRSTKDTSRMRSIILQLKQSPVPPRKS